MPEILDKIIADTDAERARIELYDEDGETVLQSARNMEGKDPPAGDDNRISRQILALVKTSQETIVSPNAMIDARFAEPGREQSTILHQKLLSVACAPLRIEGRVFGVLYVDHRRESGRFNHETGWQLLELSTLLAGSLKKSFDLTFHDREERERQELYVRTLRAQLDRLLGHEEIIGDCPAILSVRQEIDIMKDYEFPVLILGETGTGKELVAKALHRTSARHHKPFVTFDCSSVPENMLESELFGYERGAFTDARQAKPGIIDEAEGGTLFLDEIGNLILEVQQKLLRFLETKTYRRLGSTKEAKANMRLIFATNKNLHTMVFEKKFMPDLYYRLNKGRTITLPPLRERGEDILLLAEMFLRKYNKTFINKMKEHSLRWEWFVE
ncbi:MAG: sigma 54-interacting transcriptional regulator [bacterium]